MKPDCGPHLSFPFQVGTNGRLSTVSSQEEHVRDEVLQLILTNLGERLFQPEVGTGVRRLVFENLSDPTLAMTKALITQALNQWLGHRLAILLLEVVAQDSQVSVTLQYRVLASGEVKVLSFRGNGSGG